MSVLSRQFCRPPHSVDASRAHHQLQHGAIPLLDVREATACNAGHAPGARHLLLSQLNPTARPADRPVVTVCRSGTRSARAASQLRAAGLDVANLTGGMNSWLRHRLPLVTEGNQPGRLT